MVNTMNSKKSILILLVLMLLSTGLFALYNYSEARGKSLYVSKNGNDNNKGSKKSPLKTINKAIKKAKPGTTIYVMDGTYREEIVFERSGKKGAYITLKAYRKNKAKLTLKKGKGGAIISLEGQDYIAISGFDIGNVEAKEAYGILITEGSNHVSIKNNRIHDIKATDPDNDEAGANGILLLGEGKSRGAAISNIYISNNQVYNLVTGYSEAISVAGNCQYVTVKGNRVHDNTNIGIDFYGNAGYSENEELDQPRFCKAYGNIVYKCKCPYAENAGIYVDGARDCEIYNNTVYDNIYGIEVGSEEGFGKDETYPVKGILVYGNNLYNNPSGGIRVGGYDVLVSGTVIDSEIYNNTLKNNGKGLGGYMGEINIEKTSNLKVYNNTIKKSGTMNREYPLLNIGSDVGRDYINGLVLFGNTYEIDTDSKEPLFYLFDQEIKGLDTMKETLNNEIKASMEDMVKTVNWGFY